MSEIIGFTPGCFDILHPGHIHFLKHCKAHCDRLIVGLNRDESVRHLKGDKRPINDFYFRERMLLATKYVDEVQQVWDETNLRVQIQNIAPDVIFKGSDYLGKHVVGWEFAPIRFIPTLADYSTTNEIKKRGL